MPHDKIMKELKRMPQRKAVSYSYKSSLDKDSKRYTGMKKSAKKHNPY